MKTIISSHGFAGCLWNPPRAQLQIDKNQCWLPKGPFKPETFFLFEQTSTTYGNKKKIDKIVTKERETSE